jgi:hypothetical protein
MAGRNRTIRGTRRIPWGPLAMIVLLLFAEAALFMLADAISVRTRNWAAAIGVVVVAAIAVWLMARSVER